MKLIYLLALLILSAAPTWAQEVQVIDVRRNITLAEDEVPYKDFYINAGTSSGFKKNLVVKAVRTLSIRDASGAKSYGQIQVPVGQLKIIAVYDTVTVAREYSLLSRDDLPMLEQIGIMTGDGIDLQGAFVDNKKTLAPKKKSVSITQPIDEKKASVPAEMLEKVASSDN